MVTCTKIRKVSNVTVGVQLEGGERLTGEFPPTTTLTQILENLYPNVEFETAVIIYMHREVTIDYSYFTLLTSLFQLRKPIIFSGLRKRSSRLNNSTFSWNKQRARHVETIKPQS